MDLWSALSARLHAGTVGLPRHERLIAELKSLRQESFAFGSRWRVVDSSRKLHRDVSVALAGACYAAGEATVCRSPLCDDTDCTGESPYLVMGSVGSKAWEWRHSPDVIAEFEASRDRVSRAMAVAERLGRDMFGEIEAAGGGEDAVSRIVDELLRQEVA